VSKQFGRISAYIAEGGPYAGEWVLSDGADLQESVDSAETLIEDLRAAVAWARSQEESSGQD
jgi:hypothetical protein